MVVEKSEYASRQLEKGSPSLKRDSNPRRGRNWFRFASANFDAVAAAARAARAAALAVPAKKFLGRIRGG
jgi:hypothetical protein